MNKNLNNTSLYQDIRQTIEQARKKIVTTVNVAMVETYWHIGRMIVEEEQAGKERAIYGDKLIPRLAEQLSVDFGKGFNRTNLAYMRQFYLVFTNFHALRGNLSWTHYRLLLKVENPKARDFYIQETIDGQWSTRTLDRQISAYYYERLLASYNEQAVIEEAKENAIILKPEDILRDPYVLEFLQLKEDKDLSEEN